MDCVVCGKEFDAKRADAQYCSGACRKKAQRLKSSPEPKLEKSQELQEEPSVKGASLDYWNNRPERTLRVKTGSPPGSKPDIYIPAAWNQEDIVVAMEERGNIAKPWNQVERFVHEEEKKSA